MFDNYEKLNNLYLNGIAHRSKAYKHKKNDEEFYYADVDKTRTQFNRNQKDKIESKYDIPVSAKIAHAIIEQIISFVTGTKPSFQYITEAYNDQDYSEMYQELTQAVWYECLVNTQVKEMLLDTFIVGDGYLHVRTADFYNESTFNTVIQHEPWKSVIIDPASRRPDYSDASWMCVAKTMVVDAAEKKYDVKINIETANTIVFPYEIDDDIDERDMPYFTYDKKTKYTVIREMYQKEMVTLWIDERGNVTNKRPKQTTAPNPLLIKLNADLAGLREQYSALSAQLLQQQQRSQEEMNELATGTNQARAIAQMDMQVPQDASLQEQVRQAEQAIKDLEYTIANTDPMVPAYNFQKLGTEETQIVYELSKQKRKRIVRSLIVHNEIIEQEVLPIDEIPIVNCAHLHLDSPARTFGMMHLIKDFEKAINKFLQAAIYNVQLTGSPRVLAVEGTLLNRQSVESAMSTPGGIIEVRINPDLQGKDMPQFLSPQPISEAHVKLIEMCMQLSEYVSGIHSIMQGNSEGAPNSLGGINSLLTFGTQRVKQYGRNIEDTFQRLAYVLVQMLHAYVPRNKVLKYFDENKDAKEITMLDTPEDIRFRVRANVVTNMPTQKQMSAILLATIAGQTSSPEVANLLTEESIKNLDIPQAREFLQKMDVVKMMQQQIQQLIQENDFKDAQLRMLENNLSNKEIAQKQKEAEMAIEYETQKQLDSVQQQEKQFNEPMEVNL